MLKISVEGSTFTWNDGSIVRNRTVVPNDGENDVLARGIISALKFANHGGELVVGSEFKEFIVSLFHQEDLAKAAYVAAANLKYHRIKVHVGNEVIQFVPTVKPVTSNKTASVEFTDVGYKVKVSGEIRLAKPVAKKAGETETSWKLRMLLSAVSTNLGVGSYKIPKDVLEHLKEVVASGKAKQYKSKEEFIGCKIADVLEEKKTPIGSAT
jgi:hypothetical protein